MRPDYPNKIFGDKRSNYILLVKTLAEDRPLPIPPKAGPFAVYLLP